MADNQEPIDRGDGTYLVRRWSPAYARLAAAGWVIASERTLNLVVMRAYKKSWPAKP
jgi:hypothetical protein